MADHSAESILIQVAYARPERQLVVDVEVPPDTSAREAVRHSGMAREFPEIDPEEAPLGVYGRAVEGDHVLRAGDRVEIYRPLEIDPREARRQRARLR
ncbi:RnfH family protein [Aquisalimonas sp. 2447]|uniref:RnfH family protein n=1 Tax=Aquisalimonas sp. 2447 TaxID=2740807 RepID=UPI00143241F0|nr:RnfH family protein [Aquisalimonas sp. 2447]QIT55218.1 RnfH family protein [Aquisalimonas sp. 2447]